MSLVPGNAGESAMAAALRERLTAARIVADVTVDDPNLPLGGSWIATRELIRTRAWAAIQQRAAEAAAGCR